MNPPKLSPAGFVGQDSWRGDWDVKINRTATLSFILILAGIFIAAAPLERQALNVEYTVRTEVSEVPRTSTSTVTMSTTAPRLTVFHSGGELPSAVSEVSFGFRGGSLTTRLEVERSEGVKYPFTYGVFLSENSQSATYCIVMKPWFRFNVTEGLLLDVRGQPFDEVLSWDISTYPQEKVDTTFGEREMETEIPLSKLSLLTQGSVITEFYTWVHVWALGNERYLFDFIYPTMITLEAVEQTYTFKTYSTWIQTTTRPLTVAGSFTIYQQAPLKERVIATPALLILAVLLLAHQFAKKARDSRGQPRADTQDQQT